VGNFLFSLVRILVQLMSIDFISPRFSPTHKLTITLKKTKNTLVFTHTHNSSLNKTCPSLLSRFAYAWPPCDYDILCTKSLYMTFFTSLPLSIKGHIFLVPIVLWVNNSLCCLCFPSFLEANFTNVFLWVLHLICPWTQLLNAPPFCNLIYSQNYPFLKTKFAKYFFKSVITLSKIYFEAKMELYEFVKKDTKRDSLNFVVLESSLNTSIKACTPIPLQRSKKRFMGWN